MIDISHKSHTLRYAKAGGVLHASPETIQRVLKRTVPKGEVLEVARAAGINAAKRCSDWMIFCHTMPLDWIEFTFDVKEDRINVYAEAKAVWKTGVEMEALSGVTGALLNMYDMLKPIDEELSFGNIRLIKKRGGKSDFRDGFAKPISAAILVISDSTFAGEREDKSGKIIQEFLSKHPVECSVYEVLPDEADTIQQRVKQLVDEKQTQLVLTTGGTGLGPRDVTPDAVTPLIEKEVPGISEALRNYGQQRLPYAMLSRQICGVRGKSIILTLPGSSGGARDAMQALFPAILHSFHMMAGKGH
ncbi:MAG: bifunctional molybdenum cofactor biosynthesis protein MoaC/MoaB [Calditrichia bacterium]